MTEKIKVGDNLISLRAMPDASVDLIYLDPPFNSGRDYNITVVESMAHEWAYEDTWNFGEKAEKTYRDFIEHVPPGADVVAEYLTAIYKAKGRCGTVAYLIQMVPRAWECKRVLTSKGSLWLHCDQHAGHYLKVFLDLIFGEENFRNQVIWKRTSAHNNARRIPSDHDMIFLYTKSNNYTWNKVYHTATQKYKDHWDGIDTDGRKWRWADPMGRGVSNGPSSLPWRGIDPTEVGRGYSWMISRNLKENYQRVTGKELTGTPQEMLDQAYEAGFILMRGHPMYKCYVDEDPEKGVVMQGVWLDIIQVRPNSKECVVFDGQKPLALLELIIKASSNPGDLVLDPFLGSGTTAIAAQKLNRKWLGMELTHKVAQKAKERLDATFGEGCWIDESFIPTDIEEAQKLAEQHYPFSCWVVNYFDGIPRKSSHDGGIDGDITVIGFADKKSRPGVIQVKGGYTDIGAVRAFCNSVDEADAVVGLFVAWDRYITPGMIAAAKAKGTFTTGVEGDRRVFDRVQILRVEDIFNPDAQPFAKAKIPSDIVHDKNRNLVLTKIKDKQTQESIFNLMLELPQE